jgi:hypothetical protein
MRSNKLHQQTKAAPLQMHRENKSFNSCQNFTMSTFEVLKTTSKNESLGTAGHLFCTPVVSISTVQHLGYNNLGQLCPDFYAYFKILDVTK